jgi:multidrug efflux pump subunit AcrA (membrane-fusion protein)
MKRVQAWLTLAALLHAGSALAQQPPAPVEISRVVEREIVATRPFVGSVEAARVSVVGSEVEGLVAEYLVEEGQRVERNAPLARLRTKQLETRLAAARALLDSRKQELAELENGSRPEEIAQARALAAQARAELEYRAWKLESTRQLRSNKSISEDEVRLAEYDKKRAEQKLAEAEASLALVEAGPRAERIAQARARLQVQEAEVRRLEDDLERHTIRAPFAGYVTSEHTEVGQWLGVGAPVAEVVALDEVDVTIPVLEDYVGGLRLGTQVAVTIDALPGRTFLGTLSAIVPRADPRGRTFPVRIRVSNPAASGSVLIKAGMFARVRLDVGEKRKALLVPKDAVVVGMGPQPLLFVVDPEKSVAMPLPVEIGIAVEDLIQVTGPLAAGMPVVVRGNERLIPDPKGAPVAITRER